MRLAELSERTQVSAATLKYYVREGLLHPGRAVSRTLADYDESHVERVVLIRTLRDVGGLSVAAISRVLAVITAPGPDRLSVLAAAQHAMSGAQECDPDHPHEGRALTWLRTRGWLVDPSDPLVEQLENAWNACESVGVGLDEERMNAYADHVEGIASIDVRTVPDDPAGAARQVIVGTVLVDPVLIALRRLAQQHVSVSELGGDAAT